MLARCPHCRQVFTAEAPGEQACHHCGQRVLVPGAAAPPLAQAELVTESAPTAEPPPLERTPHSGFANAYLQTLHDVLLQPRRFFSALPPQGPSGPPLTFAIVTIWIGSGLSQILGRAFSSPESVEKAMQALHDALGSNAAQFEQQMQPFLKMLKPQPWPTVIAWSLFAMPVIALVTVYGSALLSHFFLVLSKKAPRGFQATFRATCYAFAPWVIAAIPLGGLPALVWLIVLMSLALAAVHGVSRGAGVWAVLAPYVLLCGCACAAMAAAALLGVFSLAGM